MKDSSVYRERVFQLVRRIPRGRVMTYGQIAAILGEGYTPHTVGFVMHASDDHTPWHRVINAQGALSTLGLLLPANKQQRMLEAEGIKFDKSGRCYLERYLWTPSPARPARNENQHRLFKRASPARRLRIKRTKV